MLSKQFSSLSAACWICAIKRSLCGAIYLVRTAFLFRLLLSHLFNLAFDTHKIDGKKSKSRLFAQLVRDVYTVIITIQAASNSQGELTENRGVIRLFELACLATSFNEGRYKLLVSCVFVL